MHRNNRSSKGLIAAILMTLAITATAMGQTNAALDRMLDAHGGLDTWQSKREFTYTLCGFPLSAQVAEPNTATVDLANRLHRIDGAGFTTGYDGESAWVHPPSEDIGLPVRFFTLGSFYFIAMPYVFGDPGAIAEDTGPQMFDGETFNTVRVTFDEGIGHTDGDEYVLFIDRETHLLRLINHTVTENPDVERVTWVFDEWQETSGLLVPTHMTFHAGWNPDDPGEGAGFTIEDVALDSSAPDSSLFFAPAVASAE